MRALVILSISLLLMGFAPAEESLILKNLVDSFQQQRAEVEAAELASYADQLAQLEQQLTEKGDAAAVTEVQNESKAVKSKLQAFMEARAKAEAAAAARAKARQARVAKDAFDDEDAAAAEKYGKEKKVPVIRLRMLDATLRPGGKPTRAHWLRPEAMAKWTIRDTPPGNYRVRAVYRAKQGESGGRGVIQIVGSTDEVAFTVNSTKDNWTDLMQQDIGKLNVVKCPIEVTLRCTGLTQANAPLFDLVALWLIPDAGSAPRINPDAGGTKKVDF